MNRTKQKGSIEPTTVFFIFLMIVMIGFIIGSGKEDKNRTIRHQNCLEWISEAISDPNETEQRSTLLKTCMEQ